MSGLALSPQNSVSSLFVWGPRGPAAVCHTSAGISPAGPHWSGKASGPCWAGSRGVGPFLASCPGISPGAAVLESTISLVEVRYLAESKIPFSAAEDFLGAFSHPTLGLTFTLGLTCCRGSRFPGRAAPTDPANRQPAIEEDIPVDTRLT